MSKATGYTLIEVVVSLIILTTGMLGAIKLLTIELQHIKQLKQSYRELELARLTKAKLAEKQIQHGGYPDSMYNPN